METQVAYQLITIKEEILEPSSDINFEVKKEPIDDEDEDDLIDSSRDESVDEIEFSIQKPTRTYGTMSTLLSIKNEIMEPAPLDPLYINPELIKAEIIDDDDFSIESHALINNNIITVQHNAYVIENSKSANRKPSNLNNRKLRNDNSSQTISNKTSRKGKGQSRYTSYMLWAREKRHQLLSTHPEHQFVEISHELCKMWKNVPSNEKYNWKRKAKRLNAKAKKDKKKKPTNDEGFQEPGIPFSKMKQGAGEYSPCEGNAESNCADFSNYPMEQWTVADVTEPDSSFGCRRDRKKIEDEDFFPTKKERLAHEKLINGARPRGRPRKLTDYVCNDILKQKKNVKSATKTKSKVQSPQNCLLNRTSHVERIKVEFEVFTDDSGESSMVIRSKCPFGQIN